MVKRQGAKAGKENLQYLEGLIDACEQDRKTLPTRNGALNHQAILKRVGPNGVSRNVLQDNPAFQQRLRDYATEKGLLYSIKERRNESSDIDGASIGEMDQAEVRRLQQENNRLGQMVAVLKAENFDLKRKMKQAGVLLNEQVPMGRRIKLEPGFFDEQYQKSE
ncbi:hypothetical protein SAMN04515647_0605 [Cohaesibacter sp. ES.047]|uniref:hypothetical protein n=1 Tax=Cohaesibacter sp. ES.047 TaxID=1798205 RepID=UPI000BB84F2A|nr:hypothetical protein [Cohaesibacter sp. ES.047]SNY90438.1 hypothetical protein SAMN04515647_0605 [Cohaesibacter sp. ES.047]